MRADFITGLKVCSKCRVEQPLENFYPDASKEDELFFYCKACCKQRYIDRKTYYKTWYKQNYPGYEAARQRLIKYGVTPEKEAELRIAQQNKCPGCLQDFLIVKDVIDHDHDTGAVRGLLCRNCNWCLGHAMDDPKILLRLATYLQVAESANS